MTEAARKRLAELEHAIRRIARLADPMISSEPSIARIAEIRAIIRSLQTP